MRDLAERLSAASKHLSLIDETFSDLDENYGAILKNLENSPGFDRLLDGLYGGQSGRQMILSDLLSYILTGRGYWLATEPGEGFRNFIKIIMLVVNLLLRQESLLSSNPDIRRRLLEKLLAENIPHFFANEKEERKYRELIECEGEILTVRHPLYKVMDSMLPKSLGTVNELLVYAYLLNRSIGYVIPMLFIQRLFRHRTPIAPPDFLLVRPGHEIFGVEVGTGMGRMSIQQGKIDQVNLFTQETNIAVITAYIPNIYRCLICNYWIEYCPKIIERFSNGETETEYVQCVDCSEYDEGNCPYIIYDGRLKPGGDTRHYHYSHVRDNDYVIESALKKETAIRKKLKQYFPTVSGFERLPKITNSGT